MNSNLDKLKEVKHIGIDLDNTLIDYSRAFREIGQHFGFGVNETRESIRKALRRTDGSDNLWQEFQSKLYTEGLDFAEVASFAKTFIEFAIRENIKVSIVSHKTPTTQDRFGGLDLRTPALLWLQKHGFTPQLIEQSEVHFTSTQQEKIEKILGLEIEFFIDDLIEVIQGLSKSSSIKTWHFSGHTSDKNSGDFNDLVNLFGFNHA